MEEDAILMTHPGGLHVLHILPLSAQAPPNPGQMRLERVELVEEDAILMTHPGGLHVLHVLPLSAQASPCPGRMRLERVELVEEDAILMTHPGGPHVLHVLALSTQAPPRPDRCDYIEALHNLSHAVSSFFVSAKMRNLSGRSCCLRSMLSFNSWRSPDPLFKSSDGLSNPLSERSK